MRRKRIKVGYECIELKRFYRVLVNAKGRERGRETVVILPGTLSMLFWKINQIQLINSMGYKIKFGDFSNILMEIYNGKRFNQLGLKIPPFVITSAINTTLTSLSIFPPLENRITLKSVFLSGSLYRTAMAHEFDLKSELVYYNVPYI